MGLSLEQYNHILENKSLLSVMPDGQITNAVTVNSSNVHLFPGSFNPLHNGHKEIYLRASSGRYCFYELSILRVGKPQYNLSQLNDILKQFEWYAPVIVTASPKFADKIDLFYKVCYPSRLHWHIGIDTAIRLLEQDGFTSVSEYHSEFIVYPRGCNFTGKVRSLSDLPKAPPNFVAGQELKNTFVSSTQIRGAI